MNEVTNNTLPDGWSSLNFDEVVDMISLSKKKIKEKEYKASGKFPVIDQGQKFIGGYFDDEDMVVEDTPPYILFGDHTKVKKYIDFKFITGGDGAKVFKAKEFIHPKLLYFFLHAVKLPDRGYARHFQYLKKSLIPIPPMNEQIRIVNKIQELFSEIDKGAENLKVLKKQLEIYRQAILMSAFEGGFTEGWRTTNPNKDVSHEIHLINEERYEKSEAFSKKIKYMKLVAQDELDELPQLPKEWKWVRAGSLYYYVTSGSRGWAKYYSDTGAIFVRITNLDFNSLRIDLSEEKIQYVNLPDKAEGHRTKIDEGDFLFSITGYLGMFAIAPKLDEAYVNQHIALCKPVSRLNKKYFGYWVMAKTGGNYYINKLNKGATKAGLTLDDVQNFYVPLCSLEEQNKVVEEIEKRMSQCENIEKIINESLEKVGALKQSILKKAFEGKLASEENQDNLAEAITQS